MFKEQRFSFGCLTEVCDRFFKKKVEQDLLEKWSMLDGMKIQGYYFDQEFKPYLLEDFVRDFFGSHEVANTLLRVDPYRQFSPILKMESVEYDKVHCSLTTIELFDRLTLNGSKVARSTGHICQCMPEYLIPDSGIHDEFHIEVGNELRKLLIQDFLTPETTSSNLEDEELKNMYTEDEKKEFLFLLFQHFVLGGSLCQYEDNIGNYVEMAKILYKNLISVSKQDVKPASDDLEKFPKTVADSFKGNNISINSVVIKICSAKNENYSRDNFLFSRKHVNNFLYLVINPESNTVYTVYHHIL